MTEKLKGVFIVMLFAPVVLAGLGAWGFCTYKLAELWMHGSILEAVVATGGWSCLTGMFGLMSGVCDAD